MSAPINTTDAVQNEVSSSPLRISVLIPTYNCRALVGRAIRSALEQTFPPWEVVVVDDGSTDGTGELVRSEFGDRINYRYQENGGEGAARNTGIRMCSGDWIALLDADDWWEREKLELQAAQVRNHPEAGIVVCGAAIHGLDSDKARKMRIPAPFTREVLRELLKTRTVFPPGTAMVRRDVFAQVGGFTEGLPLGADREMWSRVVAQYDPAGMDRPLLHITELPTSMSSDPDRIVRFGLRVNRMVMKTLGDHSFLGRCRDWLTLRRADARMLLSATYLYRDQNQTRKASQTARRVLLQWPFCGPRVYRLALRLWLSTVRGERNETAVDELRER